MGKIEYIKLFENHTQYEEFKQTSGYVKPNVSACIAENEVHYNKQYDYVDLGLPSGVLWAKCNIGASVETDYGLYFQWGDVSGYTSSQVGTGEGQKAFSWSDYKYSNNGGSAASSMTKYNSTDGLTVLESSDDAAKTYLGAEWVIAQKSQFDELISTANTTSAWVTDYNGSGINGRLFTSNVNGKTLFFPAAGYCVDGSVRGVGSSVSVWSSSLSSSNVIYAWRLDCRSGGASMGSNRYRRDGFSVRGVLVPSSLA